MCHVAVYDAYVGISKDAATYIDYSGLPSVREGAQHSHACAARCLRGPLAAIRSSARRCDGCMRECGHARLEHRRCAQLYTAVHMSRHAAGERWVAIYFAVLRAATLCIADVYSGQSAQLSAATEASTLTTAGAALVAEPDAAERASVDLATGVTAQAAASTYADGGEAAGSGASFLAFGPIGIGYAWGGIVSEAVKANRQGDGAFAGEVTVPVPAPRADNPYDHRHDLTLSCDLYVVPNALDADVTHLDTTFR